MKVALAFLAAFTCLLLGVWYIAFGGSLVAGTIWLLSAGMLAALAGHLVVRRARAESDRLWTQTAVREREAEIRELHQMIAEQTRMLDAYREALVGMALPAPPPPPLESPEPEPDTIWGQALAKAKEKR